MVQFGHHLLANQNPEWSDSYIPYNNLKKCLRELKAVLDNNPSVAKESDVPEGKAFSELLFNGVETTNVFYENHIKLAGMNVNYLTDECKNSKVDLKKSDTKRKLTLQYVQTNLLKNFAILNYTAINKILKKHDKLFPAFACKVRFLEEHVQHKSVYGTQDELNKVLMQIRNLYGDTFEDGNRQRAEEVLNEAVKKDARAKERRGPEGILMKKCFLIDMDGVVYHGDRLLPGVIEFIKWVEKENKKYMFVTNGSTRTPAEIQAKLLRLGLTVPDNVFMTSAIATAMFLQTQRPGGSAFVIGDNGLTQALKDEGFTLTDDNPDYVVVGETREYNYDLIEKAINLVFKGAKLIGTNCDPVDNATHGFSPACGALAAPIEVATGKKAYFVGKPNALMFRTALAKLDCHAADAVMIGDRLDTDIQGGMEAGMDTILVLSGIAKLEDLSRFSFRPTYVLKGIFEIQNILNVDQ